MPFLLGILGKFWPYILAALLIGGALTYIKVLHVEINHYKQKAEAAEQQLEAYKKNAEETQAAFKSANNAITLQFKQSVVEANRLRETVRQSINLRITQDEASKAITVPNSSISLLNESTSNPEGKQPSTAVGVHAEQPNSPTTSDQASSGEAGISLNDVLLTGAENNLNHWSCIRQVEQWQAFWKAYEASTLAIENKK